MTNALYSIACLQYVLVERKKCLVKTSAAELSIGFQNANLWYSKYSS